MVFEKFHESSWKTNKFLFFHIHHANNSNRVDHGTSFPTFHVELPKFDLIQFCRFSKKNCAWRVLCTKKLQISLTTGQSRRTCRTFSTPRWQTRHSMSCPNPHRTRSELVSSFCFRTNHKKKNQTWYGPLYSHMVFNFTHLKNSTSDRGKEYVDHPRSPGFKRLYVQGVCALSKG